MLNVAVRKKFLFANPCAGVEFRARVEGLFRPHYVAWSEQQKIARLPAQPHPDRHRNRTSDLKGATTRFKSTRSLVGAGRFERPTPCAQGTRVGSKGSIAFREFLTFTTIWGFCFRSKSNPGGSNRCSSDTVLAQ